MPATYAHYRFGAAALQRMPADVCRTAKRHRRLFDVGLHGPDLFFFYKPVFPDRITRLGHKFHMQTGREFFTRVCRNLRMEPSEAGQAYLYGLLCHYTLDSHVHPVVEACSWEGVASHSRIEGEFERFLLEQDGKPLHLDLTKHLALTAQECRIVSRFYPGTEGKHIRQAVNSMANIRKVMQLPEGILRAGVVKTVGAVSATFRDMVVRADPDPTCAHLNEGLLERYEAAARAFPDMLQQLGAHLTYNAPLGEGFDPIFG